MSWNCFVFRNDQKWTKNIIQLRMRSLSCHCVWSTTIYATNLNGKLKNQIVIWLADPNPNPNPNPNLYKFHSIRETLLTNDSILIFSQRRRKTAQNDDDKLKFIRIGPRVYVYTIFNSSLQTLECRHRQE